MFCFPFRTINSDISAPAFAQRSLSFLLTKSIVVLPKNDSRLARYKLKISKLKYGTIEITCDVHVAGLLPNKIKKIARKIVTRNLIHF